MQQECYICHSAHHTKLKVVVKDLGYKHKNTFYPGRYNLMAAESHRQFEETPFINLEITYDPDSKREYTAESLIPVYKEIHKINFSGCAQLKRNGDLDYSGVQASMTTAPVEVFDHYERTTVPMGFEYRVTQKESHKCCCPDCNPPRHPPKPSYRKCLDIFCCVDPEKYYD